MISQKNAYRYDLQGLRAIAVLLVVAAHSNSSILQGGFIGVDLFFVLSGYLITGLLLSEVTQKGDILMFRFYARRLKRLLPALLCVMSVTAILASWLLSGVEAREQLASASYAATWTSNFYFLFSNFDYFDELAGRDLFLHTWSLGVEEQFYLIWPLLLWFALSSVKRNVVGEQAANRLLFIFLIALLIVSLILSIYWTINMPRAGYYLMPSRIWQFTLGACVYLGTRQLAENKKLFNYCRIDICAKVSLVLGLILIFLSAVLMGPDISYPGYWAIFPSLGAGLLIFSGSIVDDSQKNILGHPVMAWLGDHSYSLYLWHWPILMLGFSMGFQGNVQATVGMLLLSLLASMFTYRYVELPFWKGRWSSVLPGRIILISILAMSISLFALDQLRRQLPDVEATTDISYKWRFDVPAIYFQTCDAWYHHSRVEPCYFGSDDAENNIVLLGDSVGAQWFSMIPEIFPQSEWRTTVYTKSSCPVVDEDWFYSRIGGNYEVCTEWRNAVLDEVESQRPDVVIVGNSATYDFNAVQWIEGSARIFERLSKAASYVLVIPGTPALGFDGPGCVARNINNNVQINTELCSSTNQMQDIYPITSYLQQAVDRYENVHVLDLNQLVCPDEICRAITEDGVVVFRDGQHLTDSFVRYLAPKIRSLMGAATKGDVFLENQ